MRAEGVRYLAQNDSDGKRKIWIWGQPDSICRLLWGLVGCGGTKSSLTARMAAGGWTILGGIQPTDAARPANGPSAASVGAKLDSGKCNGAPASSDHNVAGWDARGWGIPCGACRSDAHVVHSGTAGIMANGKCRLPQRERCIKEQWPLAARSRAQINQKWPLARCSQPQNSARKARRFGTQSSKTSIRTRWE